MQFKVNKKEVVEKVFIEISLENEEEIITFKNLLSLAENQLYLNGRYGDTEFKLINQLRKLL